MEPVSTQLEDVALSFPETALPGVPSLAFSPTPEVLNISPPPSLEMQVAQLEALSEIRREIQNLTKRDWVEWLTLRTRSSRRPSVSYHGAPELVGPAHPAPLPTPADALTNVGGSDDDQ